MNAGAASVVISCEIGTQIQGAGIPDQPAEEIRDDLEANAVYLASGDTEVLFVSCDLGGMESDIARRCTDAMGKAAGIPSDAILIGCSHTHNRPVMSRSGYTKPVNEAYCAQLQEWLCSLAKEAVESATDSGIGWGIGNARLGYNRRVCYEDGTHSMYRRGGKPPFTGVEGPEDTESMALGVFDSDNNVRAVLQHGTGHPASFYGRRVITADYVGVARRLIRQALGPVPVVFFNGSFGDIAMWQQAHPQPGPRDPGADNIRLGSTLAGETLRLLHEMQPEKEVLLKHERTELELPVRLPSEETIAEGRKVLARIDAGEDIRGQDMIFAWGPVGLVERFGDDPVDRQVFHAVRIGDLAIATHPFELYCQYQIDLKRRSPAESTVVFGITDGYAGYLPTLAGALGGGYSGVPLLWARFEPAVGCRFVDTAAAMLHSLW